MKIAVCSDIHLEFGPISLENTGNAEVLILSGDICVAKDLTERDSYNIKGESDKSNKYHTFFQECSARFPHVVYIMGNHEHYHGDLAKSYDILKTNLSYLKNLHVMEKESFDLNGVTFIAGTLWTDMNKEDPSTLYGIKGYMNDYRIIEDSSEVVNYKSFDEEGKPTFKTRPAKFSPEKSVLEHKAFLEFIDSVLSADLMTGNISQKYVVVGHHAPSKASTKPQYENDTMVNGAYSSELSEFMLDRPQIKVWTHGHTHHNFDYMIGSTRVVCNPRGYIHYEGQADTFELQFLEV
jgi:predicted phosphodiesterase